MKVIATIEARMGSSRLPEKTLATVYKDYTLLELVVKRFQLCKNIDDIYIATTVEKQDDAIAEWADKNGINYYRGSEDNVLDRVARTIEVAGADIIVQMGADSAYLDFELIDHLIDVYKENRYDYVSNDMILTYPLGIYGHIVNASKIVELNKKQDLTKDDKEDVVRYIWEHPSEYKIFNIEANKDYLYPELRLTIDYPEDMKLAIEVYKYFDTIDFTTKDIIELYKTKPQLFEKVKNLVQHSAPFIKDGKK